MAEDTTVIETPVTPAETTPEPTATPEKPVGPLSRADAQRGAQERARQLETPAETPPPEPPKETPETAETETPTEASTDAPTEKTPAETPAETAGIAVDIPEAHPLRSRAKTITVGSEEDRQNLQALFNGTHVRRQQLELVESQLRESKRRESDLMEYKARAEADKSARARWEEGPEYKDAQERYKALLQQEEDGTVPAGTADAVKRGSEGGLATLTQEEYDRRVAEDVRTQGAADMRAWKSSAWNNQVVAIAPHVRALPQFQSIFETTIDVFGQELSAGAYKDRVNWGKSDEDHRERSAQLHEHFNTLFQTRLARDPEVQAAFAAENKRKEDAVKQVENQTAMQEAERKRIGDEAVRKFQDDASARRGRTPTHPLGAVPTAPRGTVPEGASEADQRDSAPLSANDVRKQAKERSRDAARQRFG